jgi:enoyl-CoA hydratase/carnithine racemase
MSDHITVGRRGAVLTIRITRPETKNALTLAMYTAMSEALDTAAADAGVRVVQIAGSGGAFTSGNDLRDFASAPAANMDAPAFQFIRRIAVFPKPLVAAVSGVAVGIGTTMLLHCDLVVAEPQARFSLPFINLGLVPEAASSLLLPRMLGHARAAELLMLGDMFDAATAERLGIINKVSAAGASDADADSWADALAAKPPSALRLTKALMKRETAAVLAQLEAEAVDFAAQLRGPEFGEAVAAFMAKRPPRFV